MLIFVSPLTQLPQWASIHPDMEDNQVQFPDVLELNVGGVHYTTSLITLVKGGDNMLSSMFSGRHHIIKDKDGRYFIDADGILFAHILRYLRTGDLPNDKLAPQVYREAKYFGLEELQRNIEQMPVMMASQARLQFQDKLDGFEENVEQILTVAGSQQGIVSDEVISYAIIAVLKDAQVVNNPSFNHNHRCWKLTSVGNITSDLYIGPWKNIGNIDVTERVYLRVLSRELEARGFTVTYSKIGGCSYQLLDTENLQCQSTLYKIVFHWHKFA